MADPLASSRRKLSWAKKNIVNLNRSITRYMDREGLYEVSSEPDPQHPERTIHKMRLLRHLPHGISERVGDIVNNLREALDHAIFGLSRLVNPNLTPGEVYFPFAATALTLRMLSKGGASTFPKN